MKWAALLVAVLAPGCATGGGVVPRPFPGAPVVAGAREPAGSAPTEEPAPTVVDGYALVGTALTFRGVPYRNGGSDPTGFDCSGFTQFVFAQYGVSLAREVREQFRQGTPVDQRNLAPGDLLFFTTTDPGASHVAILVGGDQFVHAPSSTGVVRVEHLGASYWAPRFIGARRVTVPGAGSQ
ncbi:MAG TPA: C40 family peptidase [Vicinamibacterales bacterium]